MSELKGDDRATVRGKSMAIIERNEELDMYHAADTAEEALQVAKRAHGLATFAVLVAMFAVGLAFYAALHGI